MSAGAGLARRDMLVALIALGSHAMLGATACGGPAQKPAPPAPPPIDLTSSHDLLACIPGAGLKWLIVVRARELAQAPDLVAPLATMFPEARLSTFAATHGGVDLRQMHQILFAEYTDTALYAARGMIDPARIATAFEARLTIDGRAEDLRSPPVVRLFGTSPPSTRAQIATLGRDAVAFEVGKFGPLRAFEAFAMKKLHRAKPALEEAPLSDLVPILGDAHVAAFAPAPFDVTDDFGGLLRASTAVGIGARVDHADVAITVALLGAWKDDAPAAGERFSAVMRSIAASSMGRLAALDAPLRVPTVDARVDALVFTASFSAEKIVRGFHDALDAQVTEIMK